MIQSHYEKLVVWQEAHSLCLSIYAITSHYPSDERFGLISQMRRSSSSVLTNIVEGNGRRTMPQKLRFTEVAEGSIDELDYQILLSKDLKYLSQSQCNDLRSHVCRVKYLLSKFRDGIRTKKTGISP